MEVVIRTAGCADASVVSGLIRELARANREESPVTSDYVREYLLSPGCSVLLAESGGSAVGLLSLSMRPNLYHAGQAALIEELVVRPDMRGSGIGSALVKAAIDAARQAGCAEISVSTMFENREAERFYRRLGFDDDALLLEIHFGAPGPT